MDTAKVVRLHALGGPEVLRLEELPLQGGESAKRLKPTSNNKIVESLILLVETNFGIGETIYIMDESLTIRTKRSHEAGDRNLTDSYEVIG